MPKNPTNVYKIDDVLEPQAKESLKHLELFARRTVEGVLHGTHRSKRKGVSTDFDHHKMYQPGDPLKHVDWKVSARHDRYYVKRYLEDTALSVRIVVDRSASMLAPLLGPRPAAETSKYLQAARLAASLAWLVIKESDAAGLVLTSSDETLWLPARSMETHFVRMLQALASRDGAAEDGLRVCLRTILDRAERRGLVAVISDLMFEPAAVQQELARLTAQGHEVLLFQTREPVEEEFPFNRWVQFQSFEDPAVRHRIDTVPLRKLYLAEYEDLIARWRKWAAKFDIHFVTLRTDAHIGTVLSEYLAWREEIFAK